MVQDEIPSEVALTCEGTGDKRPAAAAAAGAAAVEVGTKKCDGQLSSGKSNSCSTFKGVNRTTEMAQEENYPSWDNLPSVILLELFSYLSHENRIRASQVCRNWRYALFHPTFWKKITFKIKENNSIAWVRFLTKCFGLSMREATIRCDDGGIKEALVVLKKLSNNHQLRKLFLEPSNCTLEYPSKQTDGKSYLKPIMQALVKIIETSNCLEALSFGCIEELTANAGTFLEPLHHHHSKNLSHLCLASVKDDPDHYDFLELDSAIFQAFVKLTILSVDYDYVSDALLGALDNGKMERLVIHIHGWLDDYPGTSNRAWQLFSQKNPKCELRLNLIHSYVAVTVLDSEILRPAMPLTHIKVLFCENVNNSALHKISGWYSNILKSLIWVDSIDHTKCVPATFDPTDPDSPDPLVLVAWKCGKLEEVVFLGHKYYQENLLAIARLRGSTLKRLEFAKTDISSDDESWYRSESITKEIKGIMGENWKPLNNRELPSVILDPLDGDSRDVIMPMVLEDQK